MDCPPPVSHKATSAAVMQRLFAFLCPTSVTHPLPYQFLQTLSAPFQSVPSPPTEPKPGTLLSIRFFPPHKRSGIYFVRFNRAGYDMLTEFYRGWKVYFCLSLFWLGLEVTSLLPTYDMNMKSVHDGRTLSALSASRQLNSISSLSGADLCLGKSPCHCAAAGCQLSLSAAPQTTECSLLTFHSFSFSQLYALNFTFAPHPIKNHLLKSHFSLFWLQKTGPSAIKLWVFSAWVLMQRFPSNKACFLSGSCGSQAFLYAKKYCDDDRFQLSQACASSTLSEG